MVQKQKTAAQLFAEIEKLREQYEEATERERADDERMCGEAARAIGEVVLSLYAEQDVIGVIGEEAYHAAGGGGKGGLARLAWIAVDLPALRENLEAHPDILAKAEPVTKDRAAARFKSWAARGGKRPAPKKAAAKAPAAATEEAGREDASS